MDRTARDLEETDDEEHGENCQDDARGCGDARAGFLGSVQRKAYRGQDKQHVPVVIPMTICWNVSRNRTPRILGEYWLAASWTVRAVIEKAMAATVMVAPAIVERITRALATVVDRTRSPSSDALPSTHSSVRARTAQLRTISAGMKKRLCRTRSNRSRIRFLIAQATGTRTPGTAKNDGTRYGARTGRSGSPLRCSGFSAPFGFVSLPHDAPDAGQENAQCGTQTDPHRVLRESEHESSDSRPSHDEEPDVDAICARPRLSSISSHTEAPLVVGVAFARPQIYRQPVLDAKGQKSIAPRDLSPRILCGAGIPRTHTRHLEGPFQAHGRVRRSWHVAGEIGACVSRLASRSRERATMNRT